MVATTAHRMENIRLAFEKDEVLLEKIKAAIRTSSHHLELFEDIAIFHLGHTIPDFAEGATITLAHSLDEPPSKKRKIENGSLVPDTHAQGNTIFELQEVSFSIPTRKKLHFRITSVTSPSGETTYTFCAVNPSTQTVESSLNSFTLAHVLRLPVPEKAQKQYNYVFLPKQATGPDTDTTTAAEPMLFTLPAGPLKNFTKPQHILPDARNDEHYLLFEVFNLAGIEVQEPQSEEFSCANPESHRKNEKAYHVKSYRGGKDGFLFFLKSGIFFGFKKPLWWVSLQDVESISYTSVLQRTFNVVVNYRSGEIDGTWVGEGTGDVKEVEFSMLDQADFQGINAYVQNHGLQDASLAEGRRAKILGKQKGKVNGTKTEGDDEGDGEEEEDGRTELEKAEAQLQDEEDEMEEDFELDSDDEGDSDGSGEDDDYDEADGKGKGRRNLVEEELGSEAEEVSDDDEEEQVEEGEDEEEEEEEEEEEVKELPAPPSNPPKAPASLPSRNANEPEPEDEDQL